VLRPPLPLVDVPPMTLAIGVGLCDAARAVGAPVQLKWPNDALAHGKKLAGVLVESHSQGNRLDAVIVGIGVNLSGAALPPELAGTAIALDQAAGVAIDRAAFIEQLLSHVERWVDRYVASGLPAIASAWHERMAKGIAARARIDGADLCGEVAGLDGDGALLLRDERGGLHRVRSGDVEVIRATTTGAGTPAPLC
jgi:BirA family biotin operon repressor/biotin-[acetyl-CoA-carboxylase] ligase